MKKFIAVCLTLLLLPALAGAELALPVDETPGYAPNPAGFTESAYTDESICVTVETVEQEGVLYHVARVTIQSPTQLRTALAGAYGTNKTNKTSNIAKKYNAVAAMNGDYYNNRDNGYVVRQGITYRRKPSKSMDMLIIDDLGDFHILVKSDAEELKAMLASQRQIINAFTFGPALVIDGVVQAMPESYQFNIRRREPRSAIGQVGKLSYVMVVADGRTEASAGVTCETLAAFMGELGCVQAYNLDGGGTATLVFNGEMCNQPKGGERSISDIIYFASAVAGGFEDANDQ